MWKGAVHLLLWRVPAEVLWILQWGVPLEGNSVFVIVGLQPIRCRHVWSMIAVSWIRFSLAFLSRRTFFRQSVSFHFTNLLFSSEYSQGALKEHKVQALQSCTCQSCSNAISILLCDSCDMSKYSSSPPGGTARQFTLVGPESKVLQKCAIRNAGEAKKYFHDSFVHQRLFIYILQKHLSALMCSSHPVYHGCYKLRVWKCSPQKRMSKKFLFSF